MIESRRSPSAGIADPSDFGRVPAPFRERVNEFASRLASVEAEVARAEAEIDAMASSGRPKAVETAIHRFGSRLHEDIRATNLVLAGLVGPSEPRTFGQALVHYRSRIGPFIFRSRFAARSFDKPLGYAGDYEMMGLIYRNVNEGDDLFGRCMERAMQMHSEPQAVRNRVGFLSRRIVQSASRRPTEELRILSMACGPARELELLMESSRLRTECSVTVVLVDQDQRALEFGRTAIEEAAARSGAHVSVRSIRRNIVEVIRRGLDVGPVDIVYSSGLFDYLGDSLVWRAGDALSKLVAPGGELVIGNFSTATPNVFGMLAMFDWPLILRSADQLASLLDRPGFECHVESEAQGINLFHIARRGCA